MYANYTLNVSVHAAHHLDWVRVNCELTRWELWTSTVPQYQVILVASCQYCKQSALWNRKVWLARLTTLCGDRD